MAKKKTYTVEVDGREVGVKGKERIKFYKDGSVKKAKFKAKGVKGSPVKRINDTIKYRRDHTVKKSNKKTTYRTSLPLYKTER